MEWGMMDDLIQMYDIHTHTDIGAVADEIYYY
jgi:hypothetical protein